MFNRLISIALLIFIAVTSIFFFCGALLLWLLTVLFDKRLVILHLYTCAWAYLYVMVVPAWKVHFLGKEKINPQKTYVVTSNHQSQLDILVCFGLFFHFKWVSKAEIFKVPLIGWNMVLNRYVKLIRGDRDSIRKMMEACEERLAEGSSVFFFPEGTRSATGKVKAFKPGAFVLAKKMKLPILPIAVRGTTHALPKNSMNFHGSHEIWVTVLDEIPYEEFKDMEDGELAEMVRQRIIPHVELEEEEAA
ncbi:lysophospholipid acyltransferase family protein [Desulfatibacillum aliphaticivorans]|uniref:lysophospholipid acyltransferase family protein n=1 Tax=Desulfatibacillum aliphaticivorans TaxID=218208 RepID=UPI0003F65606|nr:lysophospholipid acyltransferase family protein [Desulfatibacillum aliphaticivorans]